MEYGGGKVLLTSQIKFKDLIPPSTQKALLSAYCIDFDWVMSILTARSFPIWLVGHPSGRADEGREKIPLKNGHLMHYIKPRAVNGVMHSKLILYVAAAFLRLVVSSANLVPCDYDGGPVQNILYVQDFAASNDGRSCRLNHDLESVLTKLMAIDFYAFIHKVFDLTDSDHFRLVQSFPMSSFVRERNNGLCLLGWAVADLRGHNEGQYSPVTVQGSSLGKLADEWLWEMYCSCTGLSRNEDARPPIKIVFPTEKYAVDYGIGCFGTIFCQSQNWNEYKCKQLFHRCAARSPLHTKIIIMPDNLFYIGSHNFTPSAWGKVTKDGSRLVVRNYELGIVLKDRPVPIPFKHPADPYSALDRPWMQSEHYD